MRLPPPLAAVAPFGLAARGGAVASSARASGLITPLPEQATAGEASRAFPG
jgi:hypothetical protein